MLGKLLRQDMKTMWRFACPMFIASAVVSVVCCTMLYFTMSFSEEVETLWGAMILVGGFYVMGLIAIAVMSSIVSVMTAVRYYKSLFTDEGYLNMVLPVKTSTLFNAKIINTVIWSVLSTVVAVICCVISFIVPTLIYNHEFLTEFLRDISYIITMISGSIFSGSLEPSGVEVVLSWLNIASGAIEGVLIIITAITVGSVLMRKHRVLGSILFYFIITFIQENLLGIFKLIMDIGFATMGDAGAIAAQVFNLVLNVGVSVGMYFISYITLNKKFNIE